MPGPHLMVLDDLDRATGHHRDDGSGAQPSESCHPLGADYAWSDRDQRPAPRGARCTRDWGPAEWSDEAAQRGRGRRVVAFSGPDDPKVALLASAFSRR